MSLMNTQPPLNLEALLHYFPKIQPPITLSEEIAHKFSSENVPLSQGLLAKYFAQWEDLDQFSEIIPCCQLESEYKFYTLIYWKASLLSHEYKVLTLSHKGSVIAQKVIAGMLSNGETIKETVATIDKDLCIYSAVGELSDMGRPYDPKMSAAFKFEILPDGNIFSEKEVLD